MSTNFSALISGLTMPVSCIVLTISVASGCAAGLMPRGPVGGGMLADSSEPTRSMKALTCGHTHPT